MIDLLVTRDNGPAFVYAPADRTEYLYALGLFFEGAEAFGGETALRMMRIIDFIEQNNIRAGKPGDAFEIIAIFDDGPNRVDSPFHQR